MISGVCGAMIGAFISTNLEVNYLKKYFGFFLLLIATIEIFTSIRKKFFSKYNKDKKTNNKNS